ncbi:excisionase family DNA-binding protein [Bacteroidota bacterium]
MRKKSTSKEINLTVRELAKQINYSPRHIYRFIQLGKITAWRPEGGRKYLITKDAVDEFLQSNKRLRKRRKVVPEEAEVSTNIDIVLGRKEHFKDLANIAKEILGGLGHVRPVGKNQYRCYGLENQEVFSSKILSRKKLIKWLHFNMIATYNQNSTLFNNFRNHLEAENLECQDLQKYLEKSPMELFKFLQLVALRKTFQGKCDICKDWCNG